MDRMALLEMGRRRSFPGDSVQERQWLRKLSSKNIYGFSEAESDVNIRARYLHGVVKNENGEAAWQGFFY